MQTAQVDRLIVAITEIADALGSIGGVDHHHQTVDGRIQIRSRIDAVIHRHHDEAGHLSRAGIAEIDPLDHLGTASKTQQTR